MARSRRRYRWGGAAGGRQPTRPPTRPPTHPPTNRQAQPYCKATLRREEVTCEREETVRSGPS
jgi:hypothetical protein